jgi:hypothetical protein
LELFSPVEEEEVTRDWIRLAMPNLVVLPKHTKSSYSTDEFLSQYKGKLVGHYIPKRKPYALFEV